MCGVEVTPKNWFQFEQCPKAAKHNGHTLTPDRIRTMLDAAREVKSPPIVVIRTTKEYNPGVATFYIPSLSGAVDRVYNVKYIHQQGMKRFTCDCPDFVHRKQVVRKLCKHAQIVKRGVAEMGGIRRFYMAVVAHIRNVEAS
jgi:hypothetical protein